MLTDNDRRLLQLLVDQAEVADFELRMLARAILSLDDELRDLRCDLSELSSR